MSIFDRIDEMTSRAVDREFASAFACTPMLSTPNGRTVPDPERSEWEGIGILTEAPADMPIDIGARNRSNDFRAMVSGAAFELSVDRTRYPAANAARQGDRYTIGDREFEVHQLRPDGLSRVAFGMALVRT